MWRRWHMPPQMSRQLGGGGASAPPELKSKWLRCPFPPFDGIFRHQGMTTSNCASSKSDAGLKPLHPCPAPPTVFPPQGPHAFSEGVRVLP